MSCSKPDLPNWKPNGCGPLEGSKLFERVKNKVLNFLVPELWFAAACRCHDKGYKIGAVRAIDPNARLKVDGEFLAEMLEKCKRLAWWKRGAARRLALSYHAAVVLHGDEQFAWCDSIIEWRKQLIDLGLDADAYLDLAEIDPRR